MALVPGLRVQGFSEALWVSKAIPINNSDRIVAGGTRNKPSDDFAKIGPAKKRDEFLQILTKLSGGGNERLFENSSKPQPVWGLP